MLLVRLIVGLIAFGVNFACLPLLLVANPDAGILNPENIMQGSQARGAFQSFNSACEVKFDGIDLINNNNHNNNHTFTDQQQQPVDHIFTVVREMHKRIMIAAKNTHVFILLLLIGAVNGLNVTWGDCCGSVGIANKPPTVIGKIKHKQCETMVFNSGGYCRAACPDVPHDLFLFPDLVSYVSSLFSKLMAREKTDFAASVRPMHRSLTVLQAAFFDVLNGACSQQCGLARATPPSPPRARRRDPLAAGRGAS